LGDRPIDRAPMPKRDPDSVRAARRVRADPTPAERALWRALREQSDVHWRRQAPIGAAIADFACLRARLVVEVDGAAHDYAGAKARDAQRTAQLETLGFMVHRLSNAEVLHDPTAAAATLRALALTRLPSPDFVGGGEKTFAPAEIRS
jgi:very-short-patch-repair endonuclease